MDKIKRMMQCRLFENTPLLNALILIVAAYFGVYIIFSYSHYMWWEQWMWMRVFNGNIVFAICETLSIVIIAAAYCLRYSYMFRKKIRPRDILRTCRLILPGLILLLALTAGGFVYVGGIPFKVPDIYRIRDVSVDNIAQVLVFCWIAVSYIMLHSQSEKKIPEAVIIPGMIYTVLRLLFIKNITLYSAVSNVLSIAFICIFYAAVYIRGGSVLIPIVFALIYGQLWDFMAAAGIAHNLVFMRVFLEGLLAVYGLLLIRRSKRGEILALWDEKRSPCPVRRYSFYDRHTVIAMLLMTLGGYYIFLWVFPHAPAEWTYSRGLSDDLAQSVFKILSALAAMAVYIWWFYPEYRPRPRMGEFLRTSRLSLPMIVALSLRFAVGIMVFSDMMLKIPAGIVICMSLKAGICEEMIWREIAVSYMMRQWKNEKMIPAAVLISGIGFGLIHLTNIMFGRPLVSAVWQFFWASVHGIFFAAVYIRGGNVLPLMVCHTVYDIIEEHIIDISGDMPEYTEISAVMVLNILHFAVTILLVVYGLFLIRRSKRGEILALWDEKWGRTAAVQLPAEAAEGLENEE